MKKPMAIDETKPRFGQRGVFDPAKVEDLTAEPAKVRQQQAA